MIDSVLVASLTALWLGILTSISPCPLATNIAAVAYLGKRIGKVQHMVLNGLAYTAGRMLSYVVLTIAVVKTMLSISAVSMFLQTYMNKILGPVLIVAGMFLLELISFDIPGFHINETMQHRIDKVGFLGATLLGILLALSFCPVSAALFFGSLIPLTIHAHYHARSAVLYSSLYGIGTALPVLMFAFFIAFGMHFVERWFMYLTCLELWGRRITGFVFILVGIYYILRLSS